MTLRPTVPIETFQVLFKGMPEGIALNELIFDSTGRPVDSCFLEVNPAVAALFGLKAEEVSGKTYQNVLGEVPQTWLDKSHQVVLTGEPCRYEELLGSGGRCFEITCFRIDQRRFASQFRDITGQKHLEKTLIENAERYQTILEDIEEGYYEVDLKGSLTFVNRAICRLFGYSQESELIGLNNREYTDSETARIVFNIYNQVYRTGEPAKGFSYAIKAKDGAERYVETSVSLQRDIKGCPIGFRGIARDITQRKQVEESLKIAQERQRVLVEQAPEALLVYDADLRQYVETNNRAERLFGCSREELLESGPHRFYHDVQPDGFVVGESSQKHIARALAGEELLFERVIHNAQGQTIIAEVRLVGLPSVHGRQVLASYIDVTERKQMEKALRQAEEKYRSIVENASDGIFQSTPTGGFIMVNPAVAKMHGYASPEDFIHSVKDVALQIYVNPDDRARMIALLRQQGRVEGFEYETYRKDGSPFWVSMNIREVRDAEGKIIHYEGSIRDIQKRKQAELSLLEEKKFIDTAINSLPGIFYVIDEQSRFVRWNHNFEMESGYTAEELFQLSPLDLFSGEDKNVVAERIIEVFTNGHSEVEAHLLTKDGETPFYFFTGHLFEAANQKYLVGMGIDITERKKSEEALRESQKSYRRIVDTASEGIAVIDTNRCYTFVNRKMAEMLGYQPEEILGLSVENFIHPDELVNHSQNMARRRSGQGETYERRYVHRDGRTIWFLASAAPILNDQGNYNGSFAMFTDISERKQSEETLKQKKNELEESNLRLEQMIGMANDLALTAEKANATKSEFLANMSHEIRTPMNGVIGMTGLLLDTKLDSEQQRYAEIIRSSGEALLELINNILDFSKIEAQKLELETLDFDLRSTLEDIAETLAIKAQERGLELSCLVDPAVSPHLRGDPGRLRQILVNLISNAIKFTQSGEVALRVEKLSETAEELGLKFSVTDTGIGIPKALQAGIFSPFVQADGSTTRKFGGTGLGLSISKQLAEMMGGEIGLESEEGQGSTFWFTAVFKRQDEKEFPIQETLADLRGVRVLVVDDHPSNRLLLMTLLKAWGCCCEEAEDGRTALVKLYEARNRKEPFQIALLDMAMPEMDGEALAAQIKTDRAIKDILLIMITSLGLRGDAARFRRLGFDGYLTKPVRQTHLRECMATVLGRAERTGAPATESLITRHTLAEAHRVQPRILVAEDNPTNQFVALSILKKMGYRAEAVANGVEAVRTLQEIPYDLVLMDCQMPEMDGYEAARRIRAAESKVINRHIPIIAMTAHALKGDREKCLEAGMDDYLPKPVQPKQVAEVLERWLKKKDAEENLRSRNEGDHSDRMLSKEETKAVFNEEELLERLSGDHALIDLVLTGFMEDVPRQIEKLRKELSLCNPSGIRHQAHSIKGAAANVAAGNLRDAALALEKIEEDKYPDEAGGMISRLEKEFAQLKGVLEQRENSGKTILELR